MSPTSTTVKARSSVRTPSRADAPPRPHRIVPGARPRPARAVPRRHVPGRLGSQQVVSVRGRRVSAEQSTPPRIWRLIVLAFVLLIAGVGLSMYLSGLTAQQTFRLQELHDTEQDLDNRIESLSRDVKNAESTSGLIGVADQDRLGVPEQAGVLRAEGGGAVVEDRPARAEIRGLVDVNGPAGRAPASSDPERTRQVTGNLMRTPQRAGAEAQSVPIPDEGRAPGQPEEGQQPQPAPVDPGANPAPYPPAAGR